MNITNKDLKRRILEISNKYQLSHIGSCLTAVDIIDEIFQLKKPDEKFVLSSGHAGLALYVVLEKYLKKDAEKIWLHHGVHPDRCRDCGIDCSSGSLGHGLPIAVGMALGEGYREFDSSIGLGVKKDVYCLISDGECTEGSIQEALRIAAEQKLTNLKVYLNYNGWGAYRKINDVIIPRDNEGYELFPVEIKYTNVDYLPFLNLPDGQQAHYHAMTEEEYQEGLKILQ